MIAEEKQDLAALYVLGSLDANEVAAFELAMRDDAELREFVRDLRETASAIALSVPSQSPLAELKDRVLQSIAAESPAQAPHSLGRENIVPHPMSWMPWAIRRLTFRLVRRVAL